MLDPIFPVIIPAYRSGWLLREAVDLSWLRLLLENEMKGDDSL